MWFCITTQLIPRQVNITILLLSEMQLLPWRRKSRLFKLIKCRYSWQRKVLRFSPVGILIGLHSSQNFFLHHHSDFVMSPEQDLLLHWYCSDPIVLMALNRGLTALDQRSICSFAAKQELTTEIHHSRLSHINSQGQKWGERKFI